MRSDNVACSVVSELGSWPLDGFEGKEVRLLTVQYGIGVHTPPHRHPTAGS